MPQISDAYLASRDFLFIRVRGIDTAIVCIEHERFIPCRPCMYRQPATTPYSSYRADIDRVLARAIPPPPAGRPT